MLEKLKEYRTGFLQTVARLDREIADISAALEKKKADRIANQGAADGLANVIATEEVLEAPKVEPSV
jgi:hypothetical protein